MDGQIPTTQWAISYLRQGKAKLAKVPVPQPGPGQVLIKVAAAPINPSDLMFLMGAYESFYKMTYPNVPGWEGAGTIIATGGGMSTMCMAGKRVSFLRKSDGGVKELGGAYQQFIVTDAANVIEQPNQTVSDEVVSMQFINPLTAICLLHRAIEGLGAKAIVQNAAASQLGRMIIYLAKKKGIPLINIVRKDEQIAQLKKECGAEYVLNQEKEGFGEELKQLSAKLGATVAFECIAGDMSGQMMDYLGAKSTVIVYGALSGQAVGAVDNFGMVLEDRKIEGFVIFQYLYKFGKSFTEKVMKEGRELNSIKEFQPTVAKQVKLSDFQAAIGEYSGNMSAGKWVLMPNSFDDKLVDGADFPEF